MLLRCLGEWCWSIVFLLFPSSFFTERMLCSQWKTCREIKFCNWAVKAWKKLICKLLKYLTSKSSLVTLGEVSEAHMFLQEEYPSEISILSYCSLGLDLLFYLQQDYCCCGKQYLYYQQHLKGEYSKPLLCPFRCQLFPHFSQVWSFLSTSTYQKEHISLFSRVYFCKWLSIFINVTKVSPVWFP